MIKAASLPIEANLLEFSHFLSRRGIAHRINEESGRQVIWVNDEAEAALVREELETFRPGQRTARPEWETGDSSPRRKRSFLTTAVFEIQRSPVTLILILASIVVAAISALGSQPQRVDELFYPLLPANDIPMLLSNIDSVTEFLQTLTPMFLHFGELHLIFNMLWLWYFGRQVESIQSSFTVAALVVFTAFVSNTAQYYTSGYNNFGGMSGVVYGLVGYVWVVHQFMPRSYLILNSNMFVFFVIALVAMEVLASSWIATGAHVGGLLSGLLAGVLMVAYYRILLQRDVVGYYKGRRG